MNQSEKSTLALQALQRDLSTNIELLMSRDDLEATSLEKGALGLTLNRLKAGKMGRPCDVEARTVWTIDRLGTVVWGPIFTSALHEWPKSDSGERMAPLCQLLVEHLPQVPDGLDGLIQVWMPPGATSGKNFLVRHIAKADASMRTMLPLPDWGDQDATNFLDECEWLYDMASPPRPRQEHFMQAGAKRLGYKTTDELEASDDAAYWALREQYGDQYSEPAECFQLIPRQDLLPYCDLGSDLADMVKSTKRDLKHAVKSGSDIDQELLEHLQQFVSLCDAMTKAVAKSSYPCLGGTFPPIQYEPHERGTALICLEELGEKQWGDCGNAQLFFDPKKGLYFDWSCF